MASALTLSFSFIIFFLIRSKNFIEDDFSFIKLLIKGKNLLTDFKVAISNSSLFESLFNKK